MSTVEMRYLLTFLKVAQLQSFTGASAELGYAQSTITGHIKGLESELGVQLLERTTSRVELTPAGERMVPYAERMVDLAAEARLAVRDGDGAIGTVVVGSIESVITYRLSPVIELFHHRFPDLQLIVRPSSCPTTQRGLRQGEFDVGLLLAEETRHPALTSVALSEEVLVVVSAPGHPLARLALVTTSELHDAVILNTEYGCPYRERFEAELNRGNDTKVRLVEFGTIEAIKQMAINGLGVTLLPRYAVARELAMGELAEVAWKVPFTMFSQIAWHKDKWISARLRLFIDETVKAFREAADLPPHLMLL